MSTPTQSSGEAGGDTRIDKVEDYFDTNAQSWSDLYDRAERVNDLVLRDRKDVAVSNLDRLLKPGSKILDAGCGAGLCSLDLMKRGHSIHGVDVAQKMLDLCAKTFAAQGLPSERYELSRRNMLESGFPDGHFDGISALGFLQYQADELKILRELHRILRPGGVIVLSGPTQTRISNYFGLAPFLRRLRDKNAGALPEGHQVLNEISTHYYSTTRLKQLFSEAGFETLDTRGHGYVNFAFIGTRLGFKGELFLHRTLTKVSRVLPFIRSWANDVMIVARKA
jgi:ubiquinone/menaquinone biosynthesis C-methylase UbiE